MMNKNTAQVIEAMNAYKGQSMTAKEWTDLLDNRLSFNTFRKYALAGETEVRTIKTEVSLENLVEMLNDCAGNDCYGCDWHYIVENGKAYEVDFLYYYKMV